ncbi:MAG TPA: thiamine pyrophosphate-dependent enzyme [Candidatus Baltobacteraceae bacterium]|nr:thiamine pyrophosphate-dependent enzyme [Candidatus Baltobacteraceae bacterium]
MSRNVADAMWELLHAAGVRRCYGIVGDALNPTIDALHRNGAVEFIHVRHEEYGGFAAVADAYLTGDPVAICGTAGPGVTHLINAMLDARKEGAPIIVIAGDVESAIIDTEALEELNPYQFFQTASLYTGRIINARQVRAVVQTALRAALVDRGPTVISLPGDIAVQSYDGPLDPVVRTNGSMLRPADADMRRLAAMIDNAERVTIFGGDGCRGAHDEVVALAQKLKAPVGYSFRGKQYLEYDNSNAVGMTGLIGYGGAYRAMHEADLLLMLGTDFPFSEFLPGKDVKKVQIDRQGKNLGRRTPIDLGLVGNVGDTVGALLGLVAEKTTTNHLDRALGLSREWNDSLASYVERGPSLRPIRPEYLVATLDRLAADDAFFGVDTGTPCIWVARYIRASAKRSIFGSFTWASMASGAPNAMGAQFAAPGRQTIALSGDGGFTMLGMGDMLTLVERKLPVVVIVFNNGSLDFVRIEQQEAGVPPFGTDFVNPNFALVAEAMGAKGIRLEDPANVEQGLREALDHRGGPVVVDAVVDPFALSIPSHVPTHTAAGFTLSAWKQVASGHGGFVFDEIVHNLDLAKSTTLID